MNLARHILQLVSFIFLVACTRPVSLDWSQLQAEDGGNQVRLILNNLPKGNDWQIVFSQMGEVGPQSDESGLVLKQVNGSIYTITPGPCFENSGSAEIRWRAGYIQRYDLGIQGAFVAFPDGKTQKADLRAHIEPNDAAPLLKAKDVEVTRFDIIPAVKSLTIGDESINLSEGLILSSSEEFEKPMKRLAEELKRIGISVGKGAAVNISKKEGISAEGYEMVAAPEGINILVADKPGAFAAVATLTAFIEQGDRSCLQSFTARDWPDLHYRGMMLDVARNFTSADNVIRLINELARNKVNTFQFHLVDDEGWRFEVSGLPELTTLGAHHGWGEEWLLPSYDCNCDPGSSASSNGYYTREQLISILKAADAAGIRVIPEIESPGHARAAIMAMNAYQKRTGDSRYLLVDPDDKSVYSSAQNFHDNVMNVALESVYNFMGKIMDELQGIYEEAGLVMDEIHVGGDEVAEGSWIGSPVIQEFMAENGMKSVGDLKTYYVKRIARMCAERGLKVCGWQEMPYHIDPSYDAEFQKVFGSANAWNTIPEWGDDYIVHTLANRGYQVVLSNVNNTYADLAYSNARDERGHSWGGTLYPKKSFALNPFNIYYSGRVMLDGSNADLTKAKDGKPELLRPENIRGVQVQLFSETIRSFDDVTSYLFPKIVGVFERGWNARPIWWEDTDDVRFEEDYAKFENVLRKNRVPVWESLGFVVSSIQGRRQGTLQTTAAAGARYSR